MCGMENLEMSGILLEVGETVGEKILQEKVA